MNKKIMAALVAFVVAVPTTAQAKIKNSNVSLPSMAILDTAINSDMSEFQNKIIYEVCFTSNKSCPNGQNFMEGKGSAVLPERYISSNGFDHGTKMTSVAINENKDMNIVFVRIIGIKPNGQRATTPTNLISDAINWLVANQSRLNIKAISMSQGHHNLRSGSTYCPDVPSVNSAVSSSVAIGIPVFFAAGNNWDSSRIDWPACITESIAVAAVDENGYIPGYSNFDTNLVDFVAKGFFNTLSPNGTTSRQVGTSVSTQVAAANWVYLSSLKPGLNYSDLYALLLKTGTSARNSKVSTNRVINLQGAING
jgi:hypothetical protein